MTVYSMNYRSGQVRDRYHCVHARRRAQWDGMKSRFHVTFRAIEAEEICKQMLVFVKTMLKNHLYLTDNSSFKLLCTTAQTKTVQGNIQRWTRRSWIVTTFSWAFLPCLSRMTQIERASMESVGPWRNSNWQGDNELGTISGYQHDRGGKSSKGELWSDFFFSLS